MAKYLIINNPMNKSNVGVIIEREEGTSNKNYYKLSEEEVVAYKAMSKEDKDYFISKLNATLSIEEKKRIVQGAIKRAEKESVKEHPIEVEETEINEPVNEVVETTDIEVAEAEITKEDPEQTESKKRGRPSKKD